MMSCSVQAFWKSSLITTEAVAQTYSLNKMFLEILQISQENNCEGLFLNKVAGLRLRLSRKS